jgi:hypothetical protein
LGEIEEQLAVRSKNPCLLAQRAAQVKANAVPRHPRAPTHQNIFAALSISVRSLISGAAMAGAPLR